MRILHAMIRLGDLERSLAFYTQVLGMKLLRRKDHPEGRFTLAFVGFAPESEQEALELTHDRDTASYDLGAGFGHVAIETDDAYAACAGIQQRGGVVTRPAAPMKHGTTVIAFVQDPDAYKIELIQRAHPRGRRRGPRPIENSRSGNRSRSSSSYDASLSPACGARSRAGDTSSASGRPR